MNERINKARKLKEKLASKVFGFLELYSVMSSMLEYGWEDVI